MAWSTLVLFFVTEVALALTPGPAVLFVLGTALRGGFGPSVGATLGILFANALYFAASAFGLGFLVARFETLFLAVKWAGAAYLAYLGISALRSEPKPADAGVAAAPRSNGTRAFGAAVALQLGNPKAILFFTALLPQFVAPQAAWSMPLQIAVLGAIGVAAECFVLLGYGAVAARAAKAAENPALLAKFERASGLCLIGCAALALAA